MAGLGIYLWLKVGMPADSFAFNMMGIGYLGIFILFCLAIKEASDELFLYNYKENGITIIDKRSEVNNRGTD